MFEIPELRIQEVEGRFVATLGNAEIPLPAPERLREEAADVCRSEGNEEAAEALRACDLSYAVGQGQGLEDDQSRAVPLEETAEVAVGGLEGLEAAFGVGAVVVAGDALVLAEVEGENGAGGQRRVGGGGRVHGASSCGGTWCWETVIPLRLPQPPRLAWILSVTEGCTMPEVVSPDIA